MYTNSDADDRLHELYRYISDTAEFVSAGLSRLMRVFADSKVSSILRRDRDQRRAGFVCALFVASGALRPGPVPRWSDAPCATWFLA